jgi:hypothetical protein
MRFCEKDERRLYALVKVLIPKLEESIQNGTLRLSKEQVSAERVAKPRIVEKVEYLKEDVQDIGEWSEEAGQIGKGVGGSRWLLSIPGVDQLFTISYHDS